jgi:nanoRNase/pAp phosphatase (c-di-AMP/oligoRNAs hydrolase)
VGRPALPSSKAQVEELAALAAGRERALILTHDNPDPDAMAAALCLSHLFESRLSIRPRIVYGGVVGRAENRSMVRALEIPLWLVDSIKFRPSDAVVLVDTQPGFANNSLPPEQAVLAVIDHHAGPAHPEVPLMDVRPH